MDTEVLFAWFWDCWWAETLLDHQPAELLCCFRGDWACTLCRTDQDPLEVHDCENARSSGAAKVPYTLSNQDQRVSSFKTMILHRSWSTDQGLHNNNLLLMFGFSVFLLFCSLKRCEKLSLLLYCHPLSAPFHEPVSPLVSPTTSSVMWYKNCNIHETTCSPFLFI